MQNILTITFLFLSSCIWAQPPDTTTTTTIEYDVEEGELKDLRFVDAYDYVFATREEAKRLFKINFLGLVPINSISDLNFDFEQKVSKYVSINNSVFIRSFLDFESFPLNNYRARGSFGLSVEPRFYYKMKKRILEGISANNLSGNYLGIRFTGEFIPSAWVTVPVLPATLDEDISNFSAELILGIQQRLFKRSYVDLAVGTGFGYEDVVYRNPQDLQPFVEKEWKWQFNFHIGMGFALGAGLNDDFDGNQCAAFKCFIEENNLVKLDLFNIFQQLNEKEIVGRMSIGYERKIGKSSFSINSAIQVAYDIPFTSGAADEKYKLGVIMEPRFYYNLKKRILKGKSAANLSANYFALQINPQWRWIEGQPNITTEVSLTPVWGFQRRLFKQGFIDYKIGIGIATGNDPIQNPLDNNYYALFTSDLKIGLAF